jgi:hypothetical protein
MGRRVLEPQLTDNACRQCYASHLCLRAPSRSHSVVTPPPSGGRTRHGLTVAPALWVVAFITVKAPLCVVVKSRAAREGEKWIRITRVWVGEEFCFPDLVGQLLDENLRSPCIRPESAHMVQQKGGPGLRLGWRTPCPMGWTRIMIFGCFSSGQYQLLS